MILPKRRDVRDLVRNMKNPQSIIPNLFRPRAVYNCMNEGFCFRATPWTTEVSGNMFLQQVFTSRKDVHA